MIRRTLARKFSRPNAAPPPPSGSSTFASAAGGGGASSAGGGEGSSSARKSKSTSPPKSMKKQQTQERWSYDLQDAPSRILQALYDIDHGYVARVIAFFCVLGGGFWAMYRAFCRFEDQKPLAKRWGWIAPRTPITLVERKPIPGTKLEVFRFALPNSYDYTGYEPVSSVRVYVDSMKAFMPTSRWFTPISHPNERGIIEFAIKECDPGRMAARLRYLQPGDRLYLGRWMKEFPYTPNTYGDLALICTSGGSSIALQLLKVMEADSNDKTKLSLLFCHQNAAAIPFENTFAGFIRRNPQRFKISYNVLSTGKRKAPIEGSEEHPNNAKLFLGFLDEETVMKAIPPPVQMADPDAVVNRSKRFAVPPSDLPAPGTSALTTSTSTAAADTKKISEVVAKSAVSEEGLVPHKTSVLVCGPMSFMAGLCGRPQPVFNYTYMQPMFYKYRGVLKDLGYERKNVYKFGVSTHYIAYHD